MLIVITRFVTRYRVVIYYILHPTFSAFVLNLMSACSKSDKAAFQVTLTLPIKTPNNQLKCKTTN